MSTTPPVDIQGISRVDTKQTDLTAAQYDGHARPGELVVDLSTYALYVANLTGNLNPIIAPPTTMSNIGNGGSNITIPVTNGNIALSVGANSNVVVWGGDIITYKANLIPDADSIYSIGNATRQWKELWVSGTTVYVGGVPLSTSGSNLQVAGNTVITQSPTGQAVANTMVANDVVVVNNVSVGGNTITANLSVTGISNLGAVGNLIITGGSNGQVLTTNGAGNLQFRSFDTVSNGTSNLSIPVANGNVNTTVGGVLVMQASPGNVTITGNMTTSGNITSGANVAAQNFNTPGNVIAGRLTVTGTTNLGSVSNVTITGGVVGQVLSTNGSGGLSWVSVALGSNGTFISNGTSSVSVPVANGNVQVVSNSTTVMQISKTAATFYTDVTMANIVAANITGIGPNVVINSNSYLTVFDTTGNTSFPGNVSIANGLSVVGVSNLGAVANVRITGGSNGQVLVTNGSGGLSWTALTGNSIANATSNITIPSAGGNIVFVSGANNTANLTGSGFDVWGNLSANTLTVRGVSNLGPASNIRITGGLVNQVLTSTGTGAVVWAAVTPSGVTAIANGSTSANIPSFDGPLLLQSSQGVSANISDQFYVTGNMVLSSNLTVQRNSFLGSLSNVKITGGAFGQVITTDGAGTLSWVTVPGIAPITAVANGNTSFATYNANVTAQISTNNTLRMDFVDANISILASNTTVFGNFIIDNSVPNVTLGSVANLRITGGTSGQFLQTNGSGELSWSTASVSTIANGTSNVNIPAAAGNVNISVNGTANVVAVTATGANITGTANISGVASSATLQESNVALGAGSAINLSSGAVFTKTVTAATAFTVNNVPPAGKVGSFLLDITNGGAFPVTWWAGMRWSGGTVPTLTTSGRDVLGFFTYDGGTTWNGLLLGKDMK